MKKQKYLVGALVILIVSACTQDPVVPDQQPIEPYFQESFADLDAQTLLALETPYESVFATQANARTTGGFADIAEIAEKLDEIFPDADVIEIESKTKRGLDVWEIKIVMEGGGLLKILIVKELGEIFVIKGCTGPFDYEVNPGGSFISFTDAKQIAIDAVGGEVAKWSLELEEEDKWEYEFHMVTDTQRFEVEIDAFTGEVISIKEKEEDEDEDNDGDEEGEDEDKDEDKNETPPNAVAEFVLDLFPGEIKHSEREDEDDLIAWKIYVVNDAGSAVKFLVQEDPIVLLRMDGKPGPFDYDIDPGEERITLGSAIEIALNEIEEESEVFKWRFRLEQDAWIYNIHLATETRHHHVEIDAVTGEVVYKESDKKEEHNEGDHDFTEPPEEVATFVLDLFPGEIKHSEKEEEDGVVAWKIYVVNIDGSAVKFLVQEEPLELLYMEGEEGPFDYDIAPGNDIISFAEARDIVFTEVEGEIEEWELENTETADGELWVYYFEIKDGNLKHEITLNGISGEIIELETED